MAMFRQYHNFFYFFLGVVAESFLSQNIKKYKVFLYYIRGKICLVLWYEGTWFYGFIMILKMFRVWTYKNYKKKTK